MVIAEEEVVIAYRRHRYKELEKEFIRRVGKAIFEDGKEISIDIIMDYREYDIHVFMEKYGIVLQLANEGQNNNGELPRTEDILDMIDVDKLSNDTIFKLIKKYREEGYNR